MTDRIHYSLQYPYALGSGERLTQVSLNRLKVSDIKAVRRLSENVNDWDSLLIARMTGLIPEDIDNMDLVDYQQLQGHFRQFAGLDALAEGTASGTGAVGEMVPLWQPSELDALTVMEFEDYLQEAAAQIRQEHWQRGANR